jgi:hypothetical protein
MNGFPAHDPGPASAPAAHGSRGPAAAAIVAGVVSVVVALSLLVFSGIIRFGTPELSSLTMASKVDGRKRPVERNVIFNGQEKRIYCCTRVKAFEDTVLEARWYRQDAQVGGFSGKFGALTDTSTVRFLVLRGNVAFYLSKPATGWLGGSYRVSINIDGKHAREAGFTITSRGQESGTTTYNDSGGLFSMELPHTWDYAEADTLRGALAGFVGPGSGYAPRVVITPTELTSVDTAYLNQVLAQQGQQGAGQFQPYSMGNNPGARRDFEWDHKYSGKKLKMHTVQVVFQLADAKVYSINCHSSAADFQKNLPVLNSIINSFKIKSQT